VAHHAVPHTLTGRRALYRHGPFLSGSALPGLTVAHGQRGVWWGPRLAPPTPGPGAVRLPRGPRLPAAPVTTPGGTVTGDTPPHPRKTTVVSQTATHAGAVAHLPVTFWNGQGAVQAASRPRGPTVPRTSAASSALPSLPLVTLCAPRPAAPENPPLRFFWAALVPGGGAPAGGRGAGGAQRAALVSTVTTPYVRHGKEAYGSNQR
jgi:hypothetical protein